MFSDRMYFLPVQETFRYHFPRSSPSPSPQATGAHNTSRGSLSDRYPYFDSSYNRRYGNMARTSRKNEVAELDHRVAPDIVLSSAPFGNVKTPNIQMRIVGGKYVPVIAQQPILKDEYTSQQRVQPLHPITLPPQQIDPRNSLDVDYYKDAHPTALVNRRPDSKDVARLQYKTLPPIQQNRTRNDMSTVFEAEPWTGNRQPSLARETEYKQNYHPDMDEMDMEYMTHTRPHTSDLYVDEEEKRELLKTLPRNVILTVDPIKLSRDQEVTACKLICKDLSNFDPKRLRDVYIDCSQHDKHLDGYCASSALENCLRRHGAYLSQSDTFRIIAAQFVDPRQQGKVNYEKVLSFIGSALEMHRKGQLGASTVPREQEDTDFRDQSLTLGPDRPRYYMQNGENLNTGSIYKDREVAKLLRMVEQELSKSTYQMDWTKWQNLFHEKDRDHRGTLSGPQIKDICYDCHLPLSDSLINQILSLCEDNNRDGQYRWPAFFEFLDKIRPSNTGLPIPVSKRPLEYAKHYPQPVANWPRSDNDTLERKETNSPRRDPSPRRGDYYKQESRQEQRQYDERGKSPPRDKPPTAEKRRERQEKKEDIDRLKYSPDRHAYRRSPDGHRSRSHDRDYYDSPNPSNDRFYVPVEQYELERRMDEFRQNRKNPSDGYKPSWQDNNTKGAKGGDRDRPREVPPIWVQPSDQDRQDQSTDRQYNTHDPRYKNQDPYDRAMQAWVQQNRHYNPFGVQRPFNSYNRRNSYAEPQRVIYQQNRLDARIGRTRTPVHRTRSLSPVRFISPVPGQQRIPNTHRGDYPNTHRGDYPSTHREQQHQYAYTQRQEQPHQRMYDIRTSDDDLHEYRPYYKPTAPYADAFGKGEGYSHPASYRPAQPDPASYPQEPRYAYADPNTYTNPAAQGQYGYQEAWDTSRYESQQYRSPPPQQQRQYSDERYRRHDDRGIQHVRDDKIRQLSNDLGSLEAKYKMTKESMKTTDQPWLQRYIKLAEALYNIDIHNTGCLPRTDVMDIVRQYNDAFNLKLDMTRANMLAISPENLDRSGNVILRPYLAALCGDNAKNK